SAPALEFAQAAQLQRVDLDDLAQVEARRLVAVVERGEGRRLVARVGAPRLVAQGGAARLPAGADAEGQLALAADDLGLARVRHLVDDAAEGDFRARLEALPRPQGA